jgi:hypothetical protein
MMDADAERFRIVDTVVRTINRLYYPPGGLDEDTTSIVMPVQEVALALIDVLCFYVTLLPGDAFLDDDQLAEHLKSKLDWLRKNPASNPLPFKATGQPISRQ